MGNIIKIQGGDALIGRCWDCIAGQAFYVCQLEDNLESLETARDKLRELRNDVMRMAITEKRPQTVQLDRVGGWLSRVDVTITEVNKLLSKATLERQKLCLTGCCSKNCKSSYTFGKSVAKSLKNVDALISEGDFKEVVMTAPVNQLQANLEALETAREELCALKEDVKHKVNLEEEPEKKPLQQVQLWLSMAEATITEVDELVTDGPHEIQKLRLGDISNYMFVGRVAKKLEDVIALKAKGDFKELLGRVPAEPDYISQLQANLKSLETTAEQLRAMVKDLKKRIALMEGPRKKPPEQVQLWLSMAEATITGAEELLRDGPQEIEKLLQKDISNKRFVGDVAKRLEDLIALRAKGDFKEVVERVLPEPVVERNYKPTVGMETMLNDVWRHLTEDDELGIVGIYGMGGVGKTTLLTQINNKLAGTTNNFDVAIWVVVSKNLKLDDIQEEIWKKIGFFDEEWAKKSLREKADDIYYVLRSKKFALFLDDIWQRVDLEKIGVPLPKHQHGSKIVFTTRSNKICRQMDAEKVMKVKPLNRKEAWALFLEKVGDIHPDILPIARDVAEECGGLPLALITVARAMAGKATVQEWKHALEVLRSAAASSEGMEDEVFQDIEIEVFASLKFSYESLHSDKIKSCFLYCSLFPEDFKILKDDLVHYWIFENFCTGNEGYNIVGSLVRVCLLEEEGKYVKMHDVIRDMALWIACKCEKEKKFFVRAGAGLIKLPEVGTWEGSKRMSWMANSIRVIEAEPKCHDLSTLFLGHNRYCRRISDGFFRFMDSLTVLDLSKTGIKELPTGISQLKSLQYLNMSETNLRQLPLELKMLVKLKYLNLENNGLLNLIPRHVISSLSSLQVLRMFKCGGFLYEKAADNIWGEGDMLIKELQGLENLNELSITIRSGSALQCFSNTSRLLNITRSLFLAWFNGKKTVNISSLLQMKDLNLLETAFNPEFEELAVDAILDEPQKHAASGLGDSMISRVKCFNSLREVIVGSNFNLRKLTWLILAPNLTILQINSNEHMEEIISTGELRGENLNLFAKLQLLKLRDLPKLKSIYSKALSFPFLEKIEVSRCPMLKKLPLNSSSAKGCKVVIEAEEDWWNDIEWEDDATRNTFLPCFTSRRRVS